jgi:putative transposase
MPFIPGKGHAALRRGRSSQPLAGYFLTLCTAGRCSGLVTATVNAAIWREVDAMIGDRTWVFRCGVIMPDHLHLVVTLGERLSLSQCVQRIKARTSAELKACGLSWERGYFDHRMHPEDAVLPVFLYIYLNPYRAGLLTSEGRWPQFRCGADDWSWFRTELESDLPVPEWLK